MIFFLEENVRKKVKWRTKVIVEDPSLFIALNQLYKYNQITRVPQSKPSKNALKLH